jgi:hypothetical protein
MNRRMKTVVVSENEMKEAKKRPEKCIVVVVVVVVVVVFTYLHICGTDINRFI